MRLLALATDYDGTIAHHGEVEQATVQVLERARKAGKKLLLVTGRHLDDLRRAFPNLELFHLVVVENGALLFDPSNGEQTLLCPPPPQALVEELQRRKVTPLDVGRGIVATWSPNETVVLEVIRDLGLEHQVIFNKGAVMVLPSGVNKASGMHAALNQLDLSPHNVVGVGDAENDHAFLNACGCAVAVANSIETVKQEVDWVTPGERGEGVQQLIERLLNPKDEPLPVGPRHRVLLGYKANEDPVYMLGRGENLLIAGASGSGKSSALSAVLEGIVGRGYQFCLVDPEGDYDRFRDALVLGNSSRTPELDEVHTALQQPDRNVVVNLLGTSLNERPQYFKHLHLRLQEMRVKTGRPHWLVIDEAHHCLPVDGNDPPLPQDVENLIAVTVRPDHISPVVRCETTRVLTTGREAQSTLNEFLESTGMRGWKPEQALEQGTALHWSHHAPRQADLIHLISPNHERKRHRRKYAEGKLGPDKSFYFKGPRGALNLRARNLQVFVELARGIDDATWQHHLQQGDYSTWFFESIKDDAVAEQLREIERTSPAPADSRERVIDVILEHYTLPE